MFEPRTEVSLSLVSISAVRINFAIAFLATAGLLGLIGCRHGSDLMPLDVGHTWDYEVKSWPDTPVITLKVARAISVASAPGVELTSDRGVSRLAWVGDCLYADRLSGTQFAPPIPLVFNAGETHERPWKGRVTFVDRSSPATATQSQAGDDLDFQGKKLHCIRSTIHLKTAAHRIEIITWFANGIGIVRQEHRTDEKLLVQLKLLK